MSIPEITGVSAHIRISAKHNAELTEDQWDDLAEAMEMADLIQALRYELDEAQEKLIDIDITFGG